MAKLNFGGVEENIITREEFPLQKAQEILKDEIVAKGIDAGLLDLRDNSQFC